MSRRKNKSFTKSRNKGPGRDSSKKGGSRPGAFDNRKKKPTPGQYKASVDKNQKGFAFLALEGTRSEDIFVNARDALQLFTGIGLKWSLEKWDIQSLRVLSHRFQELVGRYSPSLAGKGKGGSIVYERKRAREEVFLPDGAQGAQMGDWLRVSLTFHTSGPYPVTGKLIQLYGRPATEC